MSREDVLYVGTLQNCSGMAEKRRSLWTILIIAETYNDVISMQDH
jgi:hypothetical protein